VNEKTENRWISLKEAADHCGVSVKKMREVFHRADFPLGRVGNRLIVRIDELDRYITEGRAS